MTGSGQSAVQGRWDPLTESGQSAVGEVGSHDRVWPISCWGEVGSHDRAWPISCGRGRWEPMTGSDQSAVGGSDRPQFQAKVPFQRARATLQQCSTPCPVTEEASCGDGGAVRLKPPGVSWPLLGAGKYWSSGPRLVGSISQRCLF